MRPIINNVGRWRVYRKAPVQVRILAAPFKQKGFMTEQEEAERAEMALKILQSYILLNDPKQDSEAQIVDSVWMADKLIAELEK